MVTTVVEETTGGGGQHRESSKYVKNTIILGDSNDPTDLRPRFRHAHTTHSEATMHPATNEIVWLPSSHVT